MRARGKENAGKIILKAAATFVHPGTNSWWGFKPYLFIFKLKFKSEMVVKKMWMNKWFWIKIGLLSHFKFFSNFQMYYQL